MDKINIELRITGIDFRVINISYREELVHIINSDIMIM